MTQPVDAVSNTGDTTSQQPAGASSATATAETGAGRRGGMARRMAGGEGFDAAELSFVDFLGQAEPAEAPVEEPPAPVLRATVTEKVADNKAPEKAKAADARKPETPDTPPVSKAHYTDAADDSDDDFTLMMDRTRIQPADIRILQQLGQNIPVPSPMLQNLSPSLVSAMPSDYYKSLGVSKDLQDMTESAYKTQRPMRIDLADDAAVIIRLGRDGKVSAEFLPTDKAADLYYRQYLADLKSRLDAKGLPVGDLAVRSWDQQSQQQQSQQRESQNRDDRDA